MIEWLAVMSPLVFSPGPINIIAAMSGARVGLYKSLPLFAGIHTVYFVYAVAMGFGIATLVEAYPDVLVFMKYGGGLFIIWLGVSMWRKPKTGAPDIKLGYWDGVVIHALNPKYPVVLISMYSAFLSPSQSLAPQVFALSAGILALNVVAQLTWCGVGIAVGRSFITQRSAVIRDRIFATVLIFVGLWIAFR